MKQRVRLVSMALLAAITLPAAAQQDSTGLPGDQFSLGGALAMFKQAGSPEAFERLLNESGNAVNNLDLNKDGKVDYVTVTDRKEGDTHAFVLQVALNEKESQDIAVIGLEKTGDTTAVLQITGDADVYGESVLVEPAEAAPAADTDNFGPGRGPSALFAAPEGVVVNVFFWPVVRFVYRPVYQPWISPWRWSYYPGWYRQWRPHPWWVFEPMCTGFRRYYPVVYTPRVLVARRVYQPYRVSCATVRMRTIAIRSPYPGRSPGYRPFYPQRSNRPQRSSYESNMRRGPGRNAGINNPYPSGNWGEGRKRGRRG